jgi:hypothetical protein
VQSFIELHFAIGEILITGDFDHFSFFIVERAVMNAVET